MFQIKYIICFDIGGTYIKYGILDTNGEIIFKDKFVTPKPDCSIKIPETLIEKIEKMKLIYEISGVGISTAGQVDSKKGYIVMASDNLPGFTGTQLGKIIKESTGIHCFVENDVNAAALGEMWKGAAMDSKNFVCITLGTGVGGAIVIDGKLVKGVKGSAGELGHMIINENGIQCNCGSRGCYEAYSSTSALVRSYLKYNKIEKIDGEEIMRRVQGGEEIAVRVYNEFLAHVITGLVNITHILDPGLIIIGGGISAQGNTFFKEINKRFQQAVMKSYGAYTRIVQAKLENDAGIVGACYAFLNSTDMK